MDLISRKALRNDLCEEREEGTFVFTDEQAEAADKIIRYVVGRIQAQPSVPAVPLDKLCEWLERNAAGRWNGLEYTAAGWKDELTRWMEQQNAIDKC